MGLDIRWPIGLMFLLLGAVLAGYGMVGDRTIYSQSFGMNVNLVWGMVLAIFGLMMIGLARRCKRLQNNIPNDSDTKSS